MSKLQQLLAVASELDIHLVGIRMAHPLLKGSEGFPWPDGSLFANGYLPNEIFRPCAAWEITKRAEAWGGVGNHNQAQLSQEAQKELRPGVWQFQADGWVQIA
jgi:hypothetical protein